MSDPIVHRYLTWTDVEQRCRQLAQHIGGTPIARIFGVSRGGLIPAVLVARSLGVRRVSAIQVQLYDDAKVTPESGPIVYDWDGELAWARSHQEKILVVDEVVTTGKTFEALARRMPRAYFASLFISKAVSESLPANLICGETIEPNVWINFPWEN